MTPYARIPTLLATIVVAGALLAAGASTEEAKQEAKAAVPAGQQAFIKNKCNSCHTLEAAKIAKVEATEEDEDEGASDSKRKPPDLSGTGKTHTAAWMEKWLLKKELIEGERHRKKFKGTEEELKAIAGWLETFKVPVKKSKKS